MNRQEKVYQTQWACQFFAAAELTRRGYQVAFTLGNAKEVDLMVISPNKVQFKVDVKGQASRNFWLIQPRVLEPDLYFILVYLPEKGKNPDYFIMTCAEMINERDAYQRHVESGSRIYRDNLGGMNWKAVLPYQDRWLSLPA